MGSRDKTPTLKARTPQAICGFCSKPQDITVAGKFVLHTMGRWSKQRCRGGGEYVVAPKKP